MIRCFSHYTSEELTFLRDHVTVPRVDLVEMFNHHFGQQRSVESIVNVMQRHGWYRFPRHAVFQRINQSGYLEERQPDGSMRAARFAVWESIIGRIPPDHTLVPVYGDRLDLDPFNWVLVSRRVEVRLRYTGFAAAPRELKPTILAAARLCHSIESATGKRLRNSRNWRRTVEAKRRLDRCPTMMPTATVAAP